MSAVDLLPSFRLALQQILQQLNQPSPQPKLPLDIRLLIRPPLPDNQLNLQLNPLDIRLVTLLPLHALLPVLQH